MKVHIRYRDNRLDVFDTSAYASQNPFMGTNMLTNFELRFDRLGETGIWLVAHSYDANPSYRDGSHGSEAPVARRKLGWRFLLADAKEVGQIECVSMDDTVVLQRICGELVDMLKLGQMADFWVGRPSRATADRLLALFANLSVLLGPEGMTPDQVARACGCTFDLIPKLQLAGRMPEEGQQAESRKDQGKGDWMEGLDDEIPG